MTIELLFCAMITTGPGAYISLHLFLIRILWNMSYHLYHMNEKTEVKELKPFVPSLSVTVAETGVDSKTAGHTLLWTGFLWN